MDMAVDINVDNNYTTREMLILLRTALSTTGMRPVTWMVMQRALIMIQNVLLVAEQPLTVTHRTSSRVITRTTHVVGLGDYDVSSAGMLPSPILDFTPLLARWALADIRYHVSARGKIRLKNRVP